MSGNTVCCGDTSSSPLECVNHSGVLASAATSSSVALYHGAQQGRPAAKNSGIVGAQAQGHKAAVGKTGDYDAIGVDAVGMLGDKLVDQRLKHGGIDALVGATELLDAVVHPKRGRLRHEHPGKAAKVALDLRLADGRHAVADISARGAPRLA